MKDDRAKKLIVEEKKKSRNNSYPDSQNLDITKIKVFDLNGLKATPTSSPYVLPKIEAFLRASRILDRLENAIRQEEYLKVPGLKKLFREKGFFNSELIYFLAATDSSEESLGHSRFVAAYTLLLAQHSGISNRRVLIDIERGALLHDIGKIGIPERILQKKEPLSDKEMEIIKYHPLIGFAMIKEFSFLQEAAEIVLFHHERYDGCGYPFGLQGEEIPLSARLFSLSDTLDAITSDRPYRRGRSFEEALAEIEKCSGSQFDPRLVEIMLAIPAEKWQKTKEKVLKSLRQPAIH